MASKGRIAAFGFRSVPSKPGCAGADKFAEELYPRFVQRGYEVTGYNRVHESNGSSTHSYKGVTLIDLRTPRRSGVEALWHSLRATLHIIWHNTADVVHVQNGGNSIFAIPLRLCGKKVFIGEDGAEWARGKWPWYARLYLRGTRWITAHVPNGVIFDNVFVREIFENKYSRFYHFVPFGSDPAEDQSDSDILDKLDLERGGYFLFVGRFIPDKGLQYLIPAFEALDTTRKLVLVGGSADSSEFEQSLKSTHDPRVRFPGYLYGPDVHTLMRNAFAYVQPSDLEGLSPVVLENMGLGTPVICSDIRENLYVVADTALTFRKGDIADLTAKLSYALENAPALARNAVAARERAKAQFSWDAVTSQHEVIFFGSEAGTPSDPFNRQGPI
jgi:glycosyltransferase involved in cell wall biosynthesis